MEAVRVRKSVGCERTLEKDISLRSSGLIELHHVAKELEKRLLRTGFRGNTLTLKIKFKDFVQITRSFTQKQDFTTFESFYPQAKALLASVDYESHPIRLIGLSVSHPHGEDERAGQTGGWQQQKLDFKDALPRH